MRHTLPLVLGAALIGAAPVATASFHVMQIEQVIGGIGGDNSRQAIQLRMRTDFQNQLQLARVRAWDAAGANPVIVVDFGSAIGPSAIGTRILATTVGYANNGQGPAGDFTMTAIPAGYLAAGKITFEDDGGSILWSLCWGGASYTGTNTGQFTNDSDGNFGACFPGPLPVAGAQSVRFKNGAGAASTTNLADYELSTGPATFTNSSGAAARVVEMFENGFEAIGAFVLPAAAKSRPRAAHGHAGHDHGDGFVPDPTAGHGTRD